MLTEIAQPGTPFEYYLILIVAIGLIVLACLCLLLWWELRKINKSLAQQPEDPADLIEKMRARNNELVSLLAHEGLSKALTENLVLEATLAGAISDSLEEIQSKLEPDEESDQNQEPEDLLSPIIYSYAKTREIEQSKLDKFKNWLFKGMKSGAGKIADKLLGVLNGMLGIGGASKE